MVVDAVLTIIGAFLFLFLFWQKLKEDFSSEIIFTSAFSILIAIAIATIISNSFFPRWWFWTIVGFVAISFIISHARFKLHLYESIEAIVLGLLPWFGLVLLKEFLHNFEWQLLIGVLIVALLLVVFDIIDNIYKKFTWYKSGRIGFSGLFVAGLFFLIRAVVAALSSGMLSFTGTLDAVLSAVVAFVAFLGLYNLSGKGV